MALVVVVAIRAALPWAARSVLEDQANALLQGRVTVGDVDLALLRGAVVLEDVALRAEDAPPEAPPLVAWRRFWVNVGWLALARKTVEVQDVGIVGLAMHVDRLADRAFVLPAVRPTEPTEPPAEPEGEASEPWGVVIRRLTFEDGALQLEDHVADPPETRDLTLPDLHLAGLRLQPDPEAGPGRGRVRIRLRDGSVELRTRAQAVEGGFDLALRMEMTDLPLDRVHVHVPELGWSTSTGRLGGLVTAEISPTRPLVARGRVAIEDLGIEVPGEDGAALAWRSLAVEAERIDLAARHASIARVALDGGRVLVRPTAPMPLPVLPGGEEEPSVVIEAQDAGVDEPPWSWRLGTLAVTDTEATVFLEPPPLEVEVRAFEVTGASSTPDAEATVHAEVGLADGSLVLDGPVVLDPLGGTLAIRATDLDVGRLAAASGAAPVPLAARLDAELDVVAREDPLVVEGRVELTDAETKIDDGEEFLVAWKRLALGIDRVAVPGLLPFGNEGGLGAVAAELATVELDEPRVVTTLTADGIVLPGAGAPADAPPAPAGDAAPPAAPAAPADAAGGDAFSLVVGQLTVRDGDVRFTDTTVTPAYRGRLAQLTVDARGIRVPENRVDLVTLSTRVGGKAPIEVKSVRQGDAVTVTGTMRDVPLSQFNPYASAYGYRIAKGTLSLDSETTMRGGAAYDSENRFRLDRFVVTGAEGDALFKKTFGIPLTVALALLRDLDGRISLGVPVAGDEAGTVVAIGAIVREALARAIVGAIASPLKLLGAVRLGKGRIEAFEPAPVAFVPGTTGIAPGSEAQAEQLAKALGQLPAVRVRIAGRAGANDARALAEHAVLATLEDERGVLGGVRNLLSGGTRSEVRDALRARRDGKPGALEGDAAGQLDEWVAEHPIDRERLLALATARASALEKVLLEGGARADQIVVGEPKARMKGGGAEVHVDVADEPADPADAG